MAKVDLNINVQGLGDAKNLSQNFREVDDSVDDIKKGVEETTKQIKKTDKAVDDTSKQLDKVNNKVDSLASKFSNIEKLVKSISKPLKEFADNQKNVTSAMSSSQKAFDKATTSMGRNIESFGKYTTVAAKNMTQLAKNAQLAESVYMKMEKNLSSRQRSLLDKQLINFENGKLTTTEFMRKARDISVPYARAYTNAVSRSTLSPAALKYQQQENKHREQLYKLESDGAKKRAEAAARTEESVVAIGRELALTKQKVKQEEEITKQKEKQTKERAKQEESKTATQEAKAETQEIKRVKAQAQLNKYLEQEEYAEIQRQQKVEKNERARLVLRQQMKALVEGEYEVEEKRAQALALASKRLKDTTINIQNFAATRGYKGTVGLESTSQLRVQQFYKTIKDYAVEWKRTNSEEGKAADTLGRMIEDVKKFQTGVNRVHTAFGQLSSTVSATRQIGIEFRNTLSGIAEPLLNIVKTISSQAFRSSLEALKKLELSEIGFSNFFGASQVPSIMQNVKKEALLSPLSAAQLASYVNQIAPLSGGNSQLALNAAMGVAKMIQYSGGEVTTEMEYVVRNLRDVIAKGTATTIDIRQFNRAMPALKKVLQEMGLEDFIKEGELKITKETAPKLLEAFEKINEFGDVGEIFEKTSQTVSGLMERIEEQIQFLIIDVGEFSGFTQLIKDTLSDILEDSDGIINDIKTQLQFFGRDVVSWLKSRDWERLKDTAQEIFKIFGQGLKEVMSILRRALGGSDWRETFINLATTIANFVKGIAQSYSWLLGIMNSLGGSVLGSGVIQGGVKVLGFLSGNGGAAITGITRSFGNALGVLNQATFRVISTMEMQQAKLIESATTINTFDEALLIVSQSLQGVAKDILAVDSALGGILTEEQRAILTQQLETNQKRVATAAEENKIMATKLSTTATEHETAARTTNTQAIQAGGGAGLFASPKSSTLGTKVGNALSNIIRAGVSAAIIGTIGGWLSSSAASAAGEDKYTSNSIGGYVGGIAGGGFLGAKLGSMIAPGVGTAIGAALGIVGGGIYGAVNANAQTEERRKDELDAFKATVNNGNYLRDLLATMEHGNDITSNEFDSINARLVQQMNQWAAATPSGTAQMLKDYLRNIEFNGRSIDETVKVIAKDDSARGNTLWEYIKNDDIEGGNAFAANLKEAGWSSYKIAATILDKALANGSDRDKAIDYLLKWGTTQIQEGETGEDLTYEYVKSLTGRQLENVRLAIENAWTEIGKQGVQDLKISDDEVINNQEKQKLAEGLGTAMSKLLTGAVDELTSQDQLYMHRFFTSANVSNVAEQLGIIMDPSTLLSGEWGAKLYGMTSENAKIWANSSKGHGSEGYGTSSFYIPEETVKQFTEGMTGKEKWEWLENYFTDYGLTTEETIQAWKEEEAQQEAAKAEQINALEGELESIKEDTHNISYLESTNSAAWLHSLISGNQKMNNLQGQIDALKGKANGGVVHMAAGGSPRGVDTIPAMLQRGEYVVRRSAVDKVGLTAMNALNTGNLGYFAKMLGRQNIYGDYNGARTWNNTSNDNRRSTNNYIRIVNNSKGARLNRYYGLANRIS